MKKILIAGLTLACATFLWTEVGWRPGMPVGVGSSAYAGPPPYRFRLYLGANTTPETASSLRLSTGAVCSTASNITTCTFSGGGGAVSSVANSDGTLTISPTTGSVVASLALGHANTWTAAQTFQSGTLKLDNSGNTFATTLATLATAARTWTFPDASDTAVGQSTTDTLSNKTLASPALSGTTSGTYTIGGTPTLGASLVVGSDNALSIGGSTTRLSTVFTEGVNAGAAQLLEQSSIANGSTPAIMWNTGATFSNNIAYEWKNNGTYLFGIYPSGTTNYFGFDSTVSNYMMFDTTNHKIAFFATGGVLYPATDNSMDLGQSAQRWRKVFGFQHLGVQQTASSSGAITIDPTAGEVYFLTATGNVTGITVSTGLAAQMLTLVLKQDSGGTSTWPSTMTNVTFVGGTFAKTTSANGVDVYTLRYDTSASKWREVNRALNES